MEHCSSSVGTDLLTHARAIVEAETPTLETHLRRSSTPATLDPAGSLYGRLVPWDEVAEVSDNGRRRYRESFAPGGLTANGVVPVYRGHIVDDAGRLVRGPLIGRVDDLESREDGLYGRVTLADVAAAQELRALAELVGASFSVEFDDHTPTRASEVRRTSAVMTGLAVLTAPHRGAYAGAEVLSVRAAPDDPDEDDPDEGEGDEGEGDAAEVPAEGGPPIARAMIEREVLRVIGRAAGRPQPHPLARFDSAFEFMAAARASRSDELGRIFADAYHDHGRVLANQITTDNPVVIPPGWLSEVFGIIDFGRPVISAVGTRPLPPAGMEIDWPYFDGDLKTLVGQQLAEKTEITSVKVSLKKASVPLVTYAGGSDISWQLIRRSQPSYREAYLRIMQLAYAAVTDEAATDFIAGITGGQSVDWDPAAADPDGTLLRGAIFQASVLVQQATGRPASFVLAAPDVFVKFGGMPMMVPTSYGTQNVAGTATASSLDVNVSGLSVALAPDLPAGTAIVSNQLAVSWFEDGPFVVSAQDVAKLGEDVAIWSMSAMAAFIPAGVVELSNTTPLAASQSRTAKK